MRLLLLRLLLIVFCTGLASALGAGGTIAVMIYIDRPTPITITPYVGPPTSTTISWLPSNGYPYAQQLTITISNEEINNARTFRARHGGSYRDMLGEAENEYDNSWVTTIEKIATTTGQPDYEVARDVVQQGMRWSPQQGAAHLPDESWSGAAGDCDDMAIALAALLHRLGFAVGVWLIPLDFHMAVLAVVPVNLSSGSYVDIDGRRYAYIEATTPAGVGAIPAFPHWYQGQAIFPD